MAIFLLMVVILGEQYPTEVSKGNVSDHAAIAVARSIARVNVYNNQSARRKLGLSGDAFGDYLSGIPDPEPLLPSKCSSASVQLSMHGASCAARNQPSLKACANVDTTKPPPSTTNHLPRTLHLGFLDPSR